MDHKEAYELLESYSLGILEPEETQGLEIHLDSGCVLCEEHLRDLGRLSVQMADSLPKHEPSDSVKEKLMARVRDRGAAKMKSPQFRNKAGWIVASAALAAALFLTIKVTNLQNDVNQLSQTLAETEDVTELLSSPGMQFVDLKGVEPNAQAFGKVVVNQEKGNAVVYMYRLPQTPEGMEYQLWVMRDGKPSSAGVFTVSEEGRGVITLFDMIDPETFPTFLVTIEPEGGEIAPTGMMYLTGP